VRKQTVHRKKKAGYLVFMMQNPRVMQEAGYRGKMENVYDRLSEYSFREIYEAIRGLDMENMAVFSDEEKERIQKIQERKNL